MLIIPVKNNDLEKSLKNFKSKVLKTKMIVELQNRKNYKKKSDIKRQILNDAIYKNSKNNEL
ncbi:30S ribosomal protein S21 [uncultured Caudovirales phage]|jgi:ribosomal protein S21|uniref:30S ribosomal protein S21 n=1 Tax=uncultured Caudovirales phage TaxID=2100421 RepID=A0A6J5LA25_9CAUD|nr:30S ribosomal protein S21 [uncultured Caudovirales phage]